MKIKRPGVVEAIAANTSAREALTTQLRAIDGNGFMPDTQDPPGVTVESFDEQLAAIREGFAQAQADLMNNLVQIIYEIGRLRGVLEERNRQERT